MWPSTMAIQRFRAYLQRRNYAAHTLDNYTLDLQLFFAEIDRPIHHVSFREIDRFIDAQHHQGFAPATVNRRLYTLRHFFDFLIEQEVVDTNPHQTKSCVTTPGDPGREP